MLRWCYFAIFTDLQTMDCHECSHVIRKEHSLPYRGIQAFSLLLYLSLNINWGRERATQLLPSRSPCLCNLLSCCINSIRVSRLLSHTIHIGCKGILRVWLTSSLQIRAANLPRLKWSGLGVLAFPYWQLFDLFGRKTFQGSTPWTGIKTTEPNNTTGFRGYEVARVSRYWNQCRFATSFCDLSGNGAVGNGNSPSMPGSGWYQMRGLMIFAYPVVDCILILPGHILGWTWQTADATLCWRHKRTHQIDHTPQAASYKAAISEARSHWRSHTILQLGGLTLVVSRRPHVVATNNQKASNLACQDHITPCLYVDHIWQTTEGWTNVLLPPACLFKSQGLLQKEVDRQISSTMQYGSLQVLYSVGNIPTILSNRASRDDMHCPVNLDSLRSHTISETTCKKQVRTTWETHPKYWLLDRHGNANLASGRLHVQHVTVQLIGHQDAGNLLSDRSSTCHIPRLRASDSVTGHGKRNAYGATSRQHAMHSAVLYHQLGCHILEKMSHQPALVSRCWYWHLSCACHSADNCVVSTYKGNPATNDEMKLLGSL